jgi:hypothetical protein
MQLLINAKRPKVLSVRFEASYSSLKAINKVIRVWLIRHLKETAMMRAKR